MKKGVVFVVLAPSGSGKGSIIQQVMGQSAEARLSVSATTRAPRPGENHGEHYWFVSREEFEVMVKNDEMLEHAEYCGNYYGTPKAPLEKWAEEGFDVIVEIEVQGAAQVKKLLPDSVSVFVLPPSMEILEKRLRDRGTESEEVIKGRLETAKLEIPYSQNCDYAIVNDHLEDAVAELKAIMTAETLKKNKNDLIKGVM
ncbi:guanylate kinase [Scatolibacter rhodanostii]|uniref:guanylate kinase n=1 Tax=Scatolibacter rhodanostii TaxID=2014781 RepID=UPI000C07EDD2|nr:guanylate kinase [Scatolibacter rhodanostii]